MIYKSFSESDKPHSLLGFGAMRLPKLPDGGIDETAVTEMVRRAITDGINYFDTAYMYHGGASEVVIGKALSAYPRDSFLLADKLPMWEVKEKEDMERIFTEQLRRCGVEYFDCYLVHSVGKSTLERVRQFDTISFLKKKKAEGKIHSVGFSFHDDLDCMKDTLSLYKWDFCQLQLNYADWNRYKAKELYELAVAHKLPVIVMEPVRGGFLANPPQQIKEILETADKSSSYASWALRFVASLPNVKLILSGMSNDEQLADNLKTFDGDGIYLSQREGAVMDDAIKVLESIKSVPCTGCRYCMPCPSGVDIPSIFSVYNSVKLFNRGQSDYVETVAPENRADHCISCGACTAICPQHIEIPQRLSEAHKYLTAPKN